MGVSRERDKFAKLKGEMFLPCRCLGSLYLKGKGPFIDRKRLDNYERIIFISTMGFT
jgi:hypothetical protein